MLTNRKVLEKDMELPSADAGENLPKWCNLRKEILITTYRNNIFLKDHLKLVQSK